MIKTGICSIPELLDRSRRRALFGGTKRPSITLYEEADRLADPEPAEQVLLSFSDAKGVYKRTYGKRFERFDELAAAEIRKSFQPGAALTVHDAAVSDGRTACDFFLKLRESFPALTYYASDLDRVVNIVTAGHMRLAATRQGKLVEICWPPFVFNLVKPENYRLYPLNFALSLLLRWRAAAILRRNPPAHAIQLSCREALRLSREHPGFRLIEHDLLDAFAHPVDVVRAMNVLNRDYFTDAQLQRIVANIFASMREGGLFIMGSNEDAGSPVRGAIYRRTGGRLVAVAPADAPHFAHEMILGFRANQL